MKPITARTADGAAPYRVRAFARAVLALGVAVSVAANVLHAQDTLVGRAIAAWPPLALLLTVELISRVPVHRRWLAVVRVAVTAAVAGIAAWVSYWHMVEVAVRAGESGTAAHLIPLSVDGTVIAASICLVELNGRLRALTLATPPYAQEQEQGADDREETGVSPAPALSNPLDRDAHRHGELKQPDQDRPQHVPARRPRTEETGRRTLANGSRVKAAAAGTASPVDTAVAVARIRRTSPSLTVAEIAARLDVHPRTVRRHLAALDKTSTTAAVTAPESRRASTDTSTSAIDTSTDTATEADDASASRAA
jgi:DNA-binding transcriptional ArsR family regulator